MLLGEVEMTEFASSVVDSEGFEDVLVSGSTVLVMLLDSLGWL